MVDCQATLSLSFDFSFCSLVKSETNIAPPTATINAMRSSITPNGSSRLLRSLMKLVVLGVALSDAFVVVPSYYRSSTSSSPSIFRLAETIVSPFDDSSKKAGTGSESSGGGGNDGTATATKIEGPLELTWDNVELVLDEMRPYLIQDGGNVRVP